MNKELSDIIWNAISDLEYSEVELVQTIWRANLGMPQGFVTNQNLHLFRKFRNEISNDPYELIERATHF